MAYEYSGVPGNMRYRRYKWFIVCEMQYSDACPDPVYSDPMIMKGVSAKSVEDVFSERDWNLTVRCDYGGSYAPTIHHRAIMEFYTEEEARKALPGWEEIVKRKKEESRKCLTGILW